MARGRTGVCDPSLSIRPLSDGDVDTVVELDRAGSGISRRGFVEKRLAATGRHPANYISIAALEGNRLVGFAFCHMTEGEYGGAEITAVLDAIGVSPVAQGRGIGRSMLQSLTDSVRDRGCRELRTQARWDQRGLMDFFSRSGFQLRPSVVLECATSHEPDAGEEPDTRGDELARDRIPVRSLAAGDLASVIRIDRKITGRDRRHYYEQKFDEVLNESGIRISLVAEDDGQLVGFVMARVDYGEFGRADTVAALDTIAVDPDFQGRHVGRALVSQLFANLRSLRVDHIRTSVDWGDTALIRFLEDCGFRPAQRLSLHRRLH